MNNDSFGDYCQELVLNHCKEKYNAFIKSKGTNGYDLILYYSTSLQNHELKIEVKGMSQLFKGKSHQLNRFKINTDYVKDDLTHFAFIIQDSKLIPEPILFIIPAKCIFNYIQNKKSHFSNIPLWWLSKHYKPIKIENSNNTKESE